MNVYNVDNAAEIQVTYQPKIKNKPKVKTSTEAYVILKRFIPQETIALQEYFLVMYLNNSSLVLGVYKLSVGGRSGTIADPRLILSIALKVAATSMILCHNHPSGNLKPSEADKMLTRKLTNASALLDMTIADHIIISGNGDGYLSFADDGLL